MFLCDRLLLLCEDFGPCGPSRPLLDRALYHLPLLLKVDFRNMRKFCPHPLFLVDGCLAFGYEVVTLSNLRGVSFLGQLRDSHVFGDFPIDISYA